MMYAVIIIAGVVAGAVELLLLRQFIRFLLKGDALKGAALFPAKLVVLVAGLLPSLIMEPTLMWLSGVCIVAPLVVGGAAAGVWGLVKGGRADG